MWAGVKEFDFAYQVRFSKCILVDLVIKYKHENPQAAKETDKRCFFLKIQTYLWWEDWMEVACLPSRSEAGLTAFIQVDRSHSFCRSTGPRTGSAWRMWATS